MQPKHNNFFFFFISEEGGMQASFFPLVDVEQVFPTSKIL